ncbi:phage head spike fiber domain-containing protein, partial [Roseomonas sp. SXEYE001]|uniref:phage head spike fiber domain-containing protein n=2 Tax=Roseomonas xinghualingensis TaxID=2986475 RepID=UPI0038D35D87|nr:hypothetical protein [Roseomonas sp. SXEYE001]
MSDAPPLGYKPFSQAIAETPLGTILKEASVQATTAALAVAEAREEVASQVAAVASSEAAAASSAGLAASSAAAAAAAIPARARRAMGRPASTPAIIRVTRASARSVINIQRRFAEQAAQAGVLGALTWDFDPALGVPMGPIHEGRRQNLVADARTIGGTGWSRANMVVLGATTGPDGVAGSATTLQETTANASHSTTTNISVTAGLPCTSAFIVRPGPGVSTCQISYFATGFGLDAYANFDLGAGTVGTTGAAVTRAFIQPLGGGWWWIEMTAPCVSTVASQGMSLGMTLTPSAGRAPGFVGTGRTLDVWCNWIEQAPFASSPILPPMGAPGTQIRATDLWEVDPAELGTDFNPTQGTIIVDFTSRPGPFPGGAADWFGLVSLDDGTDNNLLGMALNPAHTLLEGRLVRGGVAATPASRSLTAAGARERLRYAISYDGTRMQVAARGQVGAQQPHGGLPPITRLRYLGLGAGFPAHGWLPGIDIQPAAVWDAALAALV